MLEIFIISVILISIAILGMGVQTFFSKKKRFPETHIGQNKEMRKRKIYCAQTQQKIIDRQIENDSCNSCGCS